MRRIWSEGNSWAVSGRSPDTRREELQGDDMILDDYLEIAKELWEHYGLPPQAELFKPSPACDKDGENLAICERL